MTRRGAVATLAGTLGVAGAFGLALARARADAPVPATLLDERGRQPRVAAGDEGLVAVAYGVAGEVLCRVSHDGGHTFDPAVRVATVPGLHLGMGRGPQVAALGATLVLTAIGSAGDVTAFRSTDAGRSWTGPVRVNGASRSAEEGLLSLAAGSSGVHAVWLDTRLHKTTVYLATSRDGGTTWTERAVHGSPTSPVCECCLPTIAADAEGGVAVMFRNVKDGARDMYALVSRDGGTTFADAEKLGSGTWPLDGCPMDGGGVALRGSRLISVWRREKLLYASTGPGIEVRLGEGRNAAIAVGASGAVEAWEASDGLRLHRKSTAAAESLGPGRAPSLAATADGPLVLAWERPEGGVLVTTLRP